MVKRNRNENIIEFTQKAHPSGWFQVADELNHSVEILYKDIDKSLMGNNEPNGKSILKPTVSRSYFLVAGMVIENLLKSLVIIKHPNLISDGKLDKKISTGHSLIALLNRIELKLSKEEVDLIKIFSEAIPYWSRYPIPKFWNQLKDEQILSDSIHETYKLLYEKLRIEIYESTKFGWVGPEGEKVNEWFCSEYEPHFSIEKYQSTPFEEILKERRNLKKKKAGI